DGGAYASSSTAVTSNAASFACGPYAVPNALIESTCVYTNNPPCGAMRGFGAVQTCFAAEAQMDKLAAALGVDSVELRVRNAPAEVGQGVVNVIAQAAHTELPDHEIVVVPAGTSSVGSAGSASASRLTWMAAGAVQLACRAAREELERSGGEVDVERVYRHPRTTPLDPVTGQITGERAHVALAVSAMRVVAEVDVDLGLTRVVWIGTAQDVGHAVNPLAVGGQIEGGTAQGLGLALMEELQTRDGHIGNASFT